MLLDDIYNKSYELGVEILVELQDFVIVRELIGTHDTVAGIRPKPGSIVFHTHLTNHPPSAQDFINGLKCTVLYQVFHNGVIGSQKIFKYRYKHRLINEFVCQMTHELSQDENVPVNGLNLLIRNLKQVSINDHFWNGSTVETTECCNNIPIIVGNGWIKGFRCQLIETNREYIKSNNEAVYIKQLAALGIEMIIETRTFQ